MHEESKKISDRSSNPSAPLQSADSAEIRGIRRAPQYVYILLVEDNPADAVLFQELLELVDDFTLTCSHASTLKAAIERVKHESFDCIMLDLNLPDSVGFQTYKLMRQQAPTTAIVIMSGQSEREVMNQALKEGADNYLIKGSCDGNRIAVAVLCAIRNYVSEDRMHW